MAGSLFSMLVTLSLTSLLTVSVSGFCDMSATGAIPIPEGDLVPIDQCEYYIDLHGWPYYLSHPINCSQFWECATNGDICLFECQHCDYADLCPFGALYFNYNLQYPLGPACDWPSTIECTNGWETTSTSTTTTTTTLPSCPLPCQHWQNGACQPECCEDEDCPDDKPLCNADGACQLGCRDHQDCQDWNGECPSCQWCDKPGNVEIGQCKPGCITDDQCAGNEHCDNHECIACPLPCQTWENGECGPECCEDDDCTDGLCNNGICELGDCRSGSDCNGYNTECHKPWQTGDDNCEYCDNMDNGADIGFCQPGCENGHHDMCPTDFSCDGQHICVNEGSTLLKKIHLSTATCTGCSTTNEGGAKIYIQGTKQDCNTHFLDHPAQTDYSSGNTAVFISVVDADSMGECNNAEIAGGPKAADVSWHGVGTWKPSKVKLEVSRDYFYRCTVSGGFSGISQGEVVSMSCEDCFDSDCNRKTWKK